MGYGVWVSYQATSSCCYVSIESWKYTTWMTSLSKWPGLRRLCATTSRFSLQYNIHFCNWDNFFFTFQIAIAIKNKRTPWMSKGNPQIIIMAHSGFLFDKPTRIKSDRCHTQDAIPFDATTTSDSASILVVLFTTAAMPPVCFCNDLLGSALSTTMNSSGSYRGMNWGSG